jgi:hypothetical protein
VLVEIPEALESFQLLLRRLARRDVVQDPDQGPRTAAWILDRVQEILEPLVRPIGKIADQDAPKDYIYLQLLTAPPPLGLLYPQDFEESGRGWPRLRWSAASP